MNFEQTYQELKSKNLFPAESEKRYHLFKEMGIPSKKIEAWKYTNLNTWLNKENLSEAKNTSHKISFKHNLIAANDIIAEEDKNKINVYNYENCPSNLKNNLFTLFSEIYQKDSPYQFLLSIFNKIKVVHIEQNTKVINPIFISQNEQFYFTLILIDKSAECEIVEILENDNNYQQGVCRLLLEQNSKVEHIIIQNKSEQLITNYYTDAQLKRDAHISTYAINTGSLMARNNLNIEHTEENANSNSFGLFILNNDQHLDNKTNIIFNVAHTNGEQYYKGILDDKSHGIFNGLVRVNKDAHSVNSAQLNKNLVLGKTAQINSQPQLEVFNDDVKCSHGSTTGQLDEDQLFYFQSRGIKPEVARVQLAHAFCFDVINNIKNADLKDFVKEIINDKLNKLTAI